MNLATLIEGIVVKFFSTEAGQTLIENLIQQLLNKLISDITTAVGKPSTTLVQ